MSFFRNDKKSTTMTSETPVEERMLAWPDSYYNEREPALRRQMLDLAREKGLSPEEDRIREELFSLRYPEYGKSRQENTKDSYINAYLTFLFIANSLDKMFSFKKAKVRQAKDELRAMGIAKMAEKGRIGEDILFLEIKHMATLYYYLCREDKQYGAVLFGFGNIGEDSVAAKAGQEAYKVAYLVPEQLGMKEECALWTRAITEAYETVFPDSDSLARRIEGEDP